MDDSKGLFLFIGLFAALALAAILLGNLNEITPMAATAQTEIAVGPGASKALSQVVALIAKWLLGGIATGVAIAVYAEARKAYQAWKRQSYNRRWQGGPNAYWQQPREPRLSASDKFLLALSGRVQAPASRQRANREMPVSRDDLNVEM